MAFSVVNRQTMYFKEMPLFVCAEFIPGVSDIYRTVNIAKKMAEGSAKDRFDAAVKVIQSLPKNG